MLHWLRVKLIRYSEDTTLQSTSILFNHTKILYPEILHPESSSYNPHHHHTILIIMPTKRFLEDLVQVPVLRKLHISTSNIDMLEDCEDDNHEYEYVVIEYVVPEDPIAVNFFAEDSDSFAEDSILAWAEGEEPGDDIATPVPPMSPPAIKKKKRGRPPVKKSKAIEKKKGDRPTGTRPGRKALAQIGGTTAMKKSIEKKKSSHPTRAQSRKKQKPKEPPQKEMEKLPLNKKDPSIHLTLPSGDLDNWLLNLNACLYQTTVERRTLVAAWVQAKRKDDFWVCDQIKFHNIVISVRKELEREGYTSPRDGWMKCLPIPSSPHFPFALLFLMICTAKVNDIKIAEIIGNLCDGNKITPEWVLSHTEKDLAKKLEKLGRQDSNAKYLMKTAESVKKWGGTIPRDYRLLVKSCAGVGPKIALVTIAEIYNMAVSLFGAWNILCVAIY